MIVVLYILGLLLFLPFCVLVLAAVVKAGDAK